MADDFGSIVEQAYQSELGRPSDTEGAAYWTGLLESGAITPADLTSLFSGTAEGTAFDQRAGTANLGGISGLSVGGGGADNLGFVQQTYLDQVGRPGESAGVEYWTNLLNSGAITRDQLAAAFSGTPEGMAFDARGTETTGTGTGGGIGTTVTTTVDPGLRPFLEGQYQSEFGRAFDLPGIQYWEDQIQKGNVTKEQVADIFSKSAEGRKYDIANLAGGKTDLGYLPPELLKQYQDLQSAYKSTTFRAGDVEGLKYWLANPTDYMKALGASDEAFVQKAYRDTLKYAPDEKGLQYWMGQLAAGKVTREGLPTALINANKKIEEEKKKVEEKKIVDEKKAIADQKSQYLYDFGNFPIVAGTRTTADGKVIPTVTLNLKQRPKVSLGIGGFSPLSLTNYSYNPSSVSLFGGNRLFGSPGSTSLFKNEGASTAGQEQVVAAANGGMIMSDPVMRRAMFRAGGPVSSVGTGITANVASPEENAKALQNMFAPGFRNGGEVQYFQRGGEAMDEETAAELAAAEDQLNYRDKDLMYARVREGKPSGAMYNLPDGKERGFVRNRSLYDEYVGIPRTVVEREQGRSTSGGGPTYDQIGGEPPIVERPPSSAIGNFFRSIAGQPVFREQPSTSREDARQVAARQMEEREMYRQAAEDEANYRGKTAPAETPPPATPATREESRPPVKDRMSLRLDELRAEREANKEKRRENQLLALMQAGFAAAAGRSRNAISNIAAGGISGVQTLAELQKETRAEDRALRREIIETELAQERMREAAAERQAAREERGLTREQTGLKNLSELNARYAIAAEGLQKGLRDTIKDPLTSEEDKKAARAKLETIDRELERRALEEARLSRAILPPSMRQSSGGFPVRVVSSSPTQK